MGNVSANQSRIIKEIDREGSILVFCIANYVFVKYGNGTLTQINKHETMKNGTGYTVPMSCSDYNYANRRRMG